MAFVPLFRYTAVAVTSLRDVTNVVLFLLISALSLRSRWTQRHEVALSINEIVYLYSDSCYEPPHPLKPHPHTQIYHRRIANSFHCDNVYWENKRANHFVTEQFARLAVCVRVCAEHSTTRIRRVVVSARAFRRQ